VVVLGGDKSRCILLLAPSKQPLLKSHAVPVSMGIRVALRKSSRPIIAHTSLVEEVDSRLILHTKRTLWELYRTCHYGGKDTQVDGVVWKEWSVRFDDSSSSGSIRG
jgi:hypothetical protein